MARYDPFSPTFDHPLLNSSPDYGSRNGSFRTRPIGDLSGQISFRERNKRLRQLDDEKNQLIEDLLHQLESTQAQLDQLQVDNSRKTQYHRESQKREDVLHDQLRQIKMLIDRNSYISVLIDGDGTLFKKDFLSKGEKGGKAAANQIWDSVMESVTSSLPHICSPKIIARVYANIQLLAEVLVKNKIIDRSSVLDDFIKGFNSGRLTFDFVDSGSRKGCTRDKIREMYQISLYDCHCHQVVLACSHENEYAQLLQETTEDAELVSRVTLLEGVPLEKQLYEIRQTSGFKTMKLENIFQSCKPGNVTLKAPLQAVTATLPALTKVESNKTNGNASASNTPIMNWATVTAQAPVATPPTTKAITSAPGSTKLAEAVMVKPHIPGIERNRHGQRVDKVDSSIPPYEIQRIKKLKLCNIYHLQGPEYCSSNNCTHSHEFPLSKGEKNILREVARMTPCYYKLDCEDPECIYGHRCPQSKPNESGCYYGEDCRFWGWGHGIDTRIVKTTKV